MDWGGGAYVCVRVCEHVCMPEEVVQHLPVSLYLIPLRQDFSLTIELVLSARREASKAQILFCLHPTLPGSTGL